MRQDLGLAAVAVATGMLASTAWPVAAQTTKAPVSAASLRKQVVARLKDPDSVRFRNEFLSYSDGQPPVVSLCGQVNAKNSFGGYSGFEGFISTAEGLVVAEGAEAQGAFAAIWQVWCARPVAKAK